MIIIGCGLFYLVYAVIFIDCVEKYMLESILLDGGYKKR
jgi:amino acid transporter